MWLKDGFWAKSLCKWLKEWDTEMRVKGQIKNTTVMQGRSSFIFVVLVSSLPGVITSCFLYWFNYCKLYCVCLSHSLFSVFNIFVVIFMSVLSLHKSDSVETFKINLKQSVSVMTVYLWSSNLQTLYEFHFKWSGMGDLSQT